MIIIKAKNAYCARELFIYFFILSEQQCLQIFGDPFFCCIKCNDPSPICTSPPPMQLHVALKSRTCLVLNTSSRDECSGVANDENGVSKYSVRLKSRKVSKVYNNHFNRSMLVTIEVKKGYSHVNKC